MSNVGLTGAINELFNLEVCQNWLSGLNDLALLVLTQGCLLLRVLAILHMSPWKVASSQAYQDWLEKLPGKQARATLCKRQVKCSSISHDLRALIFSLLAMYIPLLLWVVETSLTILGSLGVDRSHSTRRV